MSPLRLAMIGAGTGRGQSWLSTVKKLADRYELCALVEVDEARAKENAERWGAPAYANLKALLAEQKPDLVFCAIPPDGNHAIACLAMAQEANVVVEIPIAPTLPLADLMIGTAAEHGVKLEVAEQVWLWPRERLKRKIIEAGLLGSIVHARLWYVSGSYHGFNAVRMLLGSEARRVLGYAGKAPVPHELGRTYLGYEIASSEWESAVIEFDNGVACLYEMPPYGPKASLWEIEGTQGQLIGNELYLGQGRDRQRFEIKYEYGTVGGEKLLEQVRVETEPPVVWENPVKRHALHDDDEVARGQILVSFHRAVTEGAQVGYGPENARRDQELCIAVKESALRGSTWIEIPIAELTEVERRMQEAYRRLHGCDAEDVEALAATAFPRGGVRWDVAGWL